MSLPSVNRREFIHLAGGAALAATLSRQLALAGPVTAPGGTAATVLSEQGSGRATAYWEQNKIITVGAKTHVVWLDAGRDGFRVRGRTLDRVSGQWAPIVTIGEAQDNHGGPALTVDSKGYLHILYYPHHAQLRYRRSAQPNDLSQWSEETKFGEELSYPVMLCAPDDTLILTARRGYHEGKGPQTVSTRMEQELWKKPANGEWRRTATLLHSRRAGYAQFAPALAWGPDHRTLHLSCRVYEGPPFGGGDLAYTVAYLVSPDAGETWTKADGSPVTLPATVETLDVLAAYQGPTGPRINCGPLAVDANGVPHIAYNPNLKDTSRLYLASPAPGLGWTRQDLTPWLPEAVKGWEIEMGMGGGMSFSDSGRATIVAVVLNPPPEERAPLKAWGHPSTEVVRLWSDDGLKTFKSEVLAPIDPHQAHWLPNIERPTGHNHVPEEPGIIYTAGAPGGGLKDLDLNNQVWWQRGQASTN